MFAHNNSQRVTFSLAANVRNSSYGLQETWLMAFELPMLNNLHKGFYAKGTPAVSVEMHVGRRYGGKAWPKSLV